LYTTTIFRKFSFREMVWKNVVEPERPQIGMLNGACAWRAGHVVLCFEPLKPGFLFYANYLVMRTHRL